MRELNVNEVEDVNGGVPLPVVLVAVRLGQLAVRAAKNKKVQDTVGIAVGAVAGWFATD